MEKASTVIRRSGVRLRTSLGGSNHADLQMVIGQLKDSKATHRAFAQSESAAWQDLTKWSLRDDNRAIQDALCQVGELCAVWADVQKTTSDGLRDFRRHFEMILEGERGVDAARSALDAAEARETRVRKELKKASKRRAAASELAELSGRLAAAERERDLAQLEAFDRAREHEIVKMVRVREGLLKVTQAYVDAAQKCEVLFAANHFIAQQIPDVSDRVDAADVKYTGTGATMQAVLTAKERIKNFRRIRRSFVPGPDHPGAAAAAGAAAACSGAAAALDLPPPYSENPPENPFLRANTSLPDALAATSHAPATATSNLMNRSFGSVVHSEPHELNHMMTRHSSAILPQYSVRDDDEGERDREFQEDCLKTLRLDDP